MTFSRVVYVMLCEARASALTMIRATPQPHDGCPHDRSQDKGPTGSLAVLLVCDFRRSRRDGSIGPHLSRMSFLTDVTPATPRATWTALSMSS